jgi:hypothetical protein
MHVTSARLLADEVRGELQQQAASSKSLNRKKRDVYVHKDDALPQFAAKINDECDALVERHRVLHGRC